jgi:predicted KAP-like P-loop ATPase
MPGLVLLLCCSQHARSAIAPTVLQAKWRLLAARTCPPLIGVIAAGPDDPSAVLAGQFIIGVACRPGASQGNQITAMARASAATPASHPAAVPHLQVFSTRTAESGKRIVIMIDDIDRLDDGEIATVFKLVKLAADFSYTYVLAFDQGVVAKALAKRYADSEGSGSSFIEKIVQVPIELPRAHEGILQDITVEAMGKVLHGAAAQLIDDDANRFALVFQRYLDPTSELPGW